MTFGFCESVDPNLAEAPAPDRRKPPVIHTVLNAFTDLPVGIALCGFLITPHNRRSMASAIGEGARACKPCEIALLELHWALGEHGTEVDQ